MKKLVILGLFAAVILMANIASATCTVEICVYDTLSLCGVELYWVDCLKIIVVCDYPAAIAETLDTNCDTWTFPTDPYTACYEQYDTLIYAVCPACSGGMPVTNVRRITPQELESCDEENETIPVTLCIQPETIPCM